MNAENIAVVIGLLAFIASDYAKALTGTICNKVRSNTASASDREHSDGPSWVEGSVDMAVGIGSALYAGRSAQRAERLAEYHAARALAFVNRPDSIEA